jgi:molybdate transport system ATP-binding protein
VIDLDIELAQGSFVLTAKIQLEARAAALFGPSGAGKTTILDAIAGLRTPRRGSIAVSGRVLYSSDARINLPAHHRHVGYVPQDVALFPHMLVRGNLLYGRHPGVSPDLDRVVGMLEIQGLLDRRVTDLSGGERQRVALGRALMSGPSLLLLDEPLAAVDVPLRRRILPYLRRVRDEMTVPIVYVSHDREEVDELADVVVNVDGGRVIGVDRVTKEDQHRGTERTETHREDESSHGVHGRTRT